MLFFSAMGDLPSSDYDGCGQKFSIRHSLECKNGGLVIVRHNDIRGFHPIRGIYLGHPTAMMPDLDPADPSVTHNFPRKGGEEQGDVLI
jgi:hypothetical protein